MLKEKMLEKEMEKYLIQNNYHIEDKEGVTDSCLVADYAADLGYDSYMLEGSGELDQTLIFIKKADPNPYYVLEK